MMAFKTFAALVAAGTLIATPAAAGDKDWRFGDGKTPERWSLVNRDYALCDAGLMQSPVDLAQAKAVGSVALDVNFGLAAGSIALGAQKVQVDFDGRHGMVSGGKAFKLVQVHFHTPSEHAVNGQRWPLVAHFVHATEAGELGVLGILFEEGEANSELATIVNGVKMGKDAIVQLNLARMLPEDLAVYRYMGSLTTPPCSEGVNWHVADKAVSASAAQIADLRAALGGDSARSLQPVGNRLIVAPRR